MEIISIDEVVDGMELSSNVTNKFGQVLLSAGAVLNESHKKLFKIWNITTVEIKTEATHIADEEEVSEEVLEIAKKLVKRQIKWRPRNKYETELVNLAYITAIETVKRNNKKE